ncbi:MAG: hypothetical protein IH885_11165, partial [Myxococcales bacterium]|nr:hypothetical protein [Myxococcales bacterium]
EADTERSQLQQNLEASRERYDRSQKHMRDLETTLSDYRVRNDALSSETDALLRERDSLHERVSELDRNARRSAIEMGSLNERAADGRERLEDATLEKSRLKGDLAAMEVDFSRVQGAFERATRELLALHDEFDQRGRRIDTLAAFEGRAGQLESELATLQADHERARAQIEGLSSGLQTSEANYEKLETTRADLLAEIEELKGTVAHYEAAVANLGDEKRTVESLLAEREVAGEASQTREREAESKISGLERTLESQQEELLGLGEQNSTLHADRERLTAEIEVHRESGSAVHSRVQKLADSLEEREAALAVLAREKSALEREGMPTARVPKRQRASTIWKMNSCAARASWPIRNGSSTTSNRR